MKKIIRSTIFMIVLSIFTIVNVNAFRGITITFEDMNLCKSIVEVTDEISDTCDTTMTITYDSQEKIDNVTSFDFSNKSIENINGIENFKNLIYLDLSNNSITNIDALKDLVKLEELDLSHIAERIDGEYQKYIDLSPLSNMTAMKYLYIGKAGVKDILPLKNMTNIIELYVGNSDVTDFSVLSNFKKLKQLGLGYSSIDDLSLLKYIDYDLEFFCVDGNNIIDVTPLKDYNMGDIDIYEQSYYGFIELDGTYNLPNIFVETLNANGFLYYDTTLILDGAVVDENFVVTVGDNVDVGDVITIRIPDGPTGGTTLELTVVESTKTDFEDEKETAKVKSKKGIDSEFILIATDKTGELKDSDIEKINQQLNTKELIKLLDLHFEDGDGNIVPLKTGGYQVKIKLTKEMKKYKDFVIAYVDKNNNVKELFEVKIEGDYLVFTTTHFSDYAVAGVPSTFDNIVLFAATGFISVIGLIGSAILYKKKRFISID